MSDSEIIYTFGAARLSRGALDTILTAVAEGRVDGLPAALEAARGLGGALYRDGQYSLLSVGGDFAYGLIFHSYSQKWGVHS